MGEEMTDSTLLPIRPTRCGVCLSGRTDGTRLAIRPVDPGVGFILPPRGRKEGV